MKVYRATVIDKVGNPTGEEPVKYESYVAVGTDEEMQEYPRDGFLPNGFSDDDIHYYFAECEWESNLNDGTIETEEFIYEIEEEVDERV